MDNDKGRSINVLRFPARHALESYRHLLIVDSQPQDLDVSKTAAVDSYSIVAAIIGAATAGSVILILATILVGYWIVKRRKRPRPWNTDEPLPEAPRKARRHSIVLSLGPSFPSRSSPSISSKELHTPTFGPQLLSSNAFAVTPMTAASPLSPRTRQDAWAIAENNTGEYEYTAYNPAFMEISTPEPTHAKLVRLVDLKRPLPVGIAQV